MMAMAPQWLAVRIAPCRSERAESSRSIAGLNGLDLSSASGIAVVVICQFRSLDINQYQSYIIRYDCQFAMAKTLAIVGNAIDGTLVRGAPASNELL
jgi:hypothetical protein